MVLIITYDVLTVPSSSLVKSTSKNGICPLDSWWGVERGQWSLLNVLHYHRHRLPHGRTTCHQLSSTLYLYSSACVCVSSLMKEAETSWRLVLVLWEKLEKWHIIECASHVDCIYKDSFNSPVAGFEIILYYIYCHTIHHYTDDHSLSFDQSCTRYIDSPAAVVHYF